MYDFVARVAGGSGTPDDSGSWWPHIIWLASLVVAGLISFLVGVSIERYKEKSLVIGWNVVAEAPLVRKDVVVGASDIGSKVKVSIGGHEVESAWAVAVKIWNASRRTVDGGELCLAVHGAAIHRVRVVGESEIYENELEVALGALDCRVSYPHLNERSWITVEFLVEDYKPGSTRVTMSKQGVVVRESSAVGMTEVEGVMKAMSPLFPVTILADAMVGALARSVILASRRTRGPR